MSVIIPHRDSIHILPKLFSSIPDRDDIEIILVDNSTMAVTKEGIGIDRRYTLLYSDPKRGAGGARNVGIENAHGRWLIFADADDYFAINAFEAFDRHADNTTDVVFFCADSIYIETGEIAGRGIPFTNLVKNYLDNKANDIFIRTRFEVPWAKMVRREFVLRNNIRYDEVVACNDTMFSTKVGCEATLIDADKSVVYIATDSHHSISKTFNKAAVLSRFNVYLEKNKYLKSLGYSDYQNSIALFVIQMALKDFPACIPMIWKIIRYHQNPFIGCSRWLNTLIRIIKHGGKVSEDWRQ